MPPCGGSLQLALATRARASAADPPKILGGVFMFFGAGAWKKTIKLQDAFCRSYWSLFGGFLLFVFARAKSQNTVIYNVFVPLAWKKYFLQHAENCLNTSVFVLLLGTSQKIVNTVISSTRSSSILNTVVLGFRGAKNIRIDGVFCSESFKTTRKHHLFDDF